MTGDPFQPDVVGFFDPSAPLTVLDGNLPHWRQDGVTYFVTFRAADSIAQEELSQWQTEREAWLSINREPHSPEQKREYWRLFPTRIHEWLDEGYGDCLLKAPESRKIVVDALEHFHCDRYLLRAWVVMPNHVQVIVTPLGEHQLSQILHSWKWFTASELNKKMGRSGPYWEKESFDHIVRSSESLERITAYIAANPKGLLPGTFSVFVK